MGPERPEDGRQKWHYLRPWIAGALAWLSMALLLSLEYLRAFGARDLPGLGLALSLLWLQFGFAGLFHALRSRQRHRVAPLFLVTLVPPGLLWVVNRVLAWWLGG